MTHPMHIHVMSECVREELNLANHIAEVHINCYIRQYDHYDKYFLVVVGTF